MREKEVATASIEHDNLVALAQRLRPDVDTKPAERRDR
jgi:hypothetical protein